MDLSDDTSYDRDALLEENMMSTCQSIGLDLPIHSDVGEALIDICEVNQMWLHRIHESCPDNIFVFDNINGWVEKSEPLDDRKIYAIR